MTAINDFMISLSRRNFLKATSAGLATPLLPALAEVENYMYASIAQCAEQSGLSFGAACRGSWVSADSDLQSLFRKQCHTLTPEISLKWNALEPERGRYDFTQADMIAEFCRSHNKRMYGHTLLWHGAQPGWLSGYLSETGDLNLIARYISTVMARYGDVVDVWDVVNEPIDPGFHQDGLRPNIFMQTFGEDYIKLAFEHARLMAPQKHLIINEYSLEYDNETENDRRYLLLRLIERMRNSGVPIDGVGLQSHLDLTKGKVSQSAIDAFLNEISNFGLYAYVTELDIREDDYTAPIAERDLRVADEVRRYLEIVLAHTHVRGVTTWGLSDSHSWLTLSDDDRAQLNEVEDANADSALNRGLPFSAQLYPKPMYIALCEALRSAPER